MSELHAASIGRVTEPVLVVEGGITEREKRRFPFRITPPHFFFSSSFVFISGRLFFSVPSSSPLLFHTQLTGKRKEKPKRKKQLCVREKTVRSKYFGRRFFFSSPSSFPLFFFFFFSRSFALFRIFPCRSREREKERNDPPPLSSDLSLAASRQSLSECVRASVVVRAVCLRASVSCTVYSEWWWPFYQ